MKLQNVYCASKDEALSISRLHVVGLPESLNSMRGERVVAWLYRYLLKKRHHVIVATNSGGVVGVIAAVDSRQSFSVLRLMVAFPHRWFVLLLTKPRRLVSLLYDSVSLAIARSQTDGHLYIAALVVDESFQRSGVARELVMEVLLSAKKAGLKVFVDTHRDNLAAQNLYKASGFCKVRETHLSVVFAHV